MRVGLPNYVELPAADIAAAKTFYADIFGWDLTDYGPSYSCTVTGTVDIGLQGDTGEATKAPLPVLPVADIEAALAAVTGAGGRIVRPIFAFPGGRRFHFFDPNGNELAIMQAA
jgi:predicted enzyme related to lactoylglutathione lyase